MPVSKDGKPFVAPGGFSPMAYDRGTAAMIARAINSQPHETQKAGVPYGVVPVGPVCP